MPERTPAPADDAVRLVDLVDRVLDRGVVLRGDVTISVAGVDLIYLELHLLLSGVDALERRGEHGPAADAVEPRAGESAPDSPPVD